MPCFPFFPMPNAQCPMPNAQFPIPNSPFPIPHSPFPIPYSHHHEKSIPNFTEPNYKCSVSLWVGNAECYSGICATKKKY
ncbi:MAG: hypothetical protein EAZ86_29915 [Oscillatoriales cyanobacterium]|nr:MAG: hypothetical protein EAZ86_29915 [Oscillatoriales cyanobacterium]